ncbi:hypothetical protein [Aeromicrobium sp.]|uniref:hypothetical protein n=1 Tax=Aeromicrobium sp. TaxID=1871063 RepID=UPI0019A3FC16|nr:hypothetical protein [Aeromicrobium sp.]MBC7631028.1 hypothetical protein [Aeromicrobium sp.]
METHTHEWMPPVLEDDYIPGIPVYVTRCGCGVVKGSEPSSPQIVTTSARVASR